MTKTAKCYCIMCLCAYFDIFFLYLFIAVIRPRLETANNHTHVVNLQHLTTVLSQIDSLQYDLCIFPSAQARGFT